MGRTSSIMIVLAIFCMWIVRRRTHHSVTKAAINPIKLAEIKDNIVTVDNDALLDLMKRDELQNTSMTILSIAGEMRTGKSFIMNLIARYLHFRGWENQNWFDDEEVVVDDFNYKSGTDVETQGIAVHPEIFQVPLADGTQTAVLLVDTQGLYDDETADDCNAKLMALSTLLSSHQILNSMKKVDKRDLNHLKLSIELAQYISGEARLRTSSEALPSLQVCTTDSCDVPNGSVEGSPISQTLSFLIRDWGWRDEYAFGDSTDGYLKKFLYKRSESEEVQKVKDHILTTFNSVNAYLLPYPGSKVEKSNGNVRNDDMAGDFAKVTKTVIESIMNQKNISPKRKIDGTTMTARELFYGIAEIGRLLKDGPFEVQAAYRSLQRGILDSLRIATVSKYEEMMEEMCRERKQFRDEELELFHEKAYNGATKQFGEKSKSVKDKELVKEYLETLKHECDITFSSVKRDNDINKVSEILGFINNRNLMN